MKIVGVQVKENLFLERSLTTIYGLGLSNVKKILLELQIENKITSALSEEELRSLNDYLRNKVMVESTLRNWEKENVMKKIKLGIYKGQRHIKKLPVRGQRTSTNASTNKLLGKRF